MCISFFSKKTVVSSSFSRFMMSQLQNDQRLTGFSSRTVRPEECPVCFDPKNHGCEPSVQYLDVKYVCIELPRYGIFDVQSLASCL